MPGRPQQLLADSGRPQIPGRQVLQRGGACAVRPSCWGRPAEHLAGWCCSSTPSSEISGQWSGRNLGFRLPGPAQLLGAPVITISSAACHGGTRPPHHPQRLHHHSCLLLTLPCTLLRTCSALRHEVGLSRQPPTSCCPSRRLNGGEHNRLGTRGAGGGAPRRAAAAPAGARRAQSLLRCPRAGRPAPGPCSLTPRFPSAAATSSPATPKRRGPDRAFGGPADS